METADNGVAFWGYPKIVREQYRVKQASIKTYFEI